MKKYIFLSFTGVLNSDEYYRNLKLKANYNDPKNEIDYVSVELLNRIVDETGAFVVVTSKMRDGYPLPLIESILRDKGFKGVIAGSTPVLNFNHKDAFHIWDMEMIRGCEIDMYLNVNARNTNYQYVIIDNGNDMLLKQKDNLITTDKSVGLTIDNVRDAIKILKSRT